MVTFDDLGLGEIMNNDDFDLSDIDPYEDDDEDCESCQ